MALGGRASLLRRGPDLATLGKAVAGGLPLSCIVGRKEIMELMMNGGVAFGGTFNGNPLSLAAAQVTLDELSRENGRPIETANETGKTLMEKIGDLAASHVRIPGQADRHSGDDADHDSGMKPISVPTRCRSVIGRFRNRDRDVGNRVEEPPATP